MFLQNWIYWYFPVVQLFDPRYHTEGVFLLYWGVIIIEADAAGIGIHNLNPIPEDSVTGFGFLIPSDLVLHRHFYHSGSGLTGCLTVQHRDIQKNCTKRGSSARVQPCQPGIDIPASWSVRNRWLRINPALRSFTVQFHRNRLVWIMHSSSLEGFMIVGKRARRS